MEVESASQERAGLMVGQGETRLAWIDAARALCVAGVVLMHFWIWVYAPTARRFPDDVGGWTAVVDVLLAFRMPTLFALSGMLVSSRVRNGWRDRRNLLRAVSSYYLYVVWLTIYALLSVVFAQRLPGAMGTPWAYFQQWLVPETPLWFVFFLAINVIVLSSLHRVHPAIVIALLVALSMCVLLADVPGKFEILGRGVYYMLFFAIGVYMRHGLESLVARGLWWKLPLAGIGFIWVSGLFPSLDYRSFEWLVAYLLRDLTAVLLGVCVAALLCWIRPIRSILQYVGRRTLAVYVLHLPVLWVMIALVRALPDNTIDNAPMRLFAPALATVAVIGVSIVVGGYLRRIGARWLFEPPEFLRDRILDGNVAALPRDTEAYRDKENLDGPR